MDKIKSLLLKIWASDGTSVSRLKFKDAMRSHLWTLLWRSETLVKSEREEEREEQTWEGGKGKEVEEKEEVKEEEKRGEGKGGGINRVARGMLTFSHFWDPSIDMFPGLLCSSGKGKLLQLSMIELMTEFLKGLWRDKYAMRLYS